MSARGHETRFEADRPRFDVQYAELDLGHLLPQLAVVFDLNTQFHTKNQDADVPTEGRFQTLENTWAHAIVETENETANNAIDVDVSSTVEPNFQFQWLEYMINYFGDDHGFELVKGVSPLIL